MILKPESLGKLMYNQVTINIEDLNFEDKRVFEDKCVFEGFGVN